MRVRTYKDYTQDMIKIHDVTSATVMGCQLWIKDFLNVAELPEPARNLDNGVLYQYRAQGFEFQITRN